MSCEDEKVLDIVSPGSNADEPDIVAEEDTERNNTGCGEFVTEDGAYNVSPLSENALNNTSPTIEQNYTSITPDDNLENSQSPTLISLDELQNNEAGPSGIHNNILEMASDVSDDDQDELSACKEVNQVHQEAVGEYPSQQADVELELDTNHSQELDEQTIAFEMSNYIRHNRVNLGEIGTIKEMWEICDAISAAHSGLPDSLLKEAYLIVLENQHKISNNLWLRDHLDRLIKMWKRELNSGKTSKRETKFISATSESVESPPLPSLPTPPTITIEPSTESKKRKRKMNAARRKALTAMMGVGDTLTHARRKFATEEGELDIDEDEYGNFTIGGVELSFERWGQINRIKDHDIVGAQSTIPKMAKRKRIKPKPKTNGYEHAEIYIPPFSDVANESSEPIAFYNTIDQEHEEFSGIRSENEVFDRMQGPEPKPEAEKDEGEISESESNKSSSSSSSAEEILKKKAKIRDNKHRRVEQKNDGTVGMQNLSAIFSKCYEYRLKIAQRLSMQQKAQFLEILKQIKGDRGIEIQQQQMTAQFMNSLLNFLKTPSNQNI